MLADLQLLRALYRELRLQTPFPRVPEPQLVMDEQESVSAFANGGSANGTLSGVYLYHMAQMCSLVRPGDSVLDLGCGPASLLTQLALWNQRAEFLGVDLSKPMLEAAQHTLSAAGVRNVEVREDDMSRLTSVPDRSADVVVSSMSLHHLPDLDALERAFYAIARVLRPGGGVYIHDFGRLKDLRSIDYLVRRAVPCGDKALATDYAFSLRAAFSKCEFERVARRALPGRVQVYATALSPAVIVIRSRSRQRIDALRPRWKETLRELPRSRRKDVLEMRLLLRLGGLSSVF